jgi:hypothetical protein
LRPFAPFFDVLFVVVCWVLPLLLEALSSFSSVLSTTAYTATAQVISATGASQRPILRRRRLTMR